MNKLANIHRIINKSFKFSEDDFANIKPGKIIGVDKEYAMGFIISRKVLEDDIMYKRDLKRSTKAQIVGDYEAMQRLLDERDTEIKVLKAKLEIHDKYFEWVDRYFKTK